ncbi:DUF2986 domain-containing protein [Psychromonas sp.]|uniref:DUF2986 domain-containing protein n=1 Tax=Psychromonas sp. TaxID=1884585 RepID=UPI003563378E
MNRKKKLNSILEKRMKRLNAKKNFNAKPKYISKAERARLEALAQSDAAQIEETTEVNQ